jgi:hypothetical protein
LVSHIKRGTQNESVSEQGAEEDIWIEEGCSDGRVEMGGACSTNGELRKVYRLLVKKPQGNRPLERPRRRWVDNITMDLGDRMRWCGLDRSGSE